MKKGYGVLLFLLVSRLIGMALIPLNETTEARYAEIARKMLETGNWVTLFHDYGVPFLAKPPLSTWLSAASMRLFGVNEFAARLPSLLLSIGMLAMVGYTAGSSAMTAMLVLAGSFGFFVAAGTSMTDPSLVFCTTLIMISFWHAVEKNSRPWAWLFFVGCGLGLLSKGPVALVLTGLPIFIWVVMQKKWKPLWQRLPWITGSMLTLAIALPWYLMAEHRTPGFLNYFIIGENIGRFLDPNWKGDRYGYAHAFPYGMIWVFTLMCLLPWSVVALGQRWSFKKPGSRRLYLMLWTLATPVFFTFAANIIWPYALMMIPGFALLFTEMQPKTRFVPQLAALMGGVGILAVLAFAFFPQKVTESQKDVITAWKADNPDPRSALIFWDPHPQFSAEFYSGGRSRSTFEPLQIKALLNNSTQDYIITNTEHLKDLPPPARRKFKEIGRLTDKQGTRILLREAR